jgi:hypothetical protein
MTDLFSRPIVVSVINGSSFKPKSKSRDIKTHVLWLNGAPKKIENAANALRSNDLKLYYKTDPFNMPVTPSVTSKFKTISGGDDDEFTLDEIGEALEAHDDDDSDTTRISGSTFVLSKNVEYNRKVSVITDNWVFPDDNLSTFKKKIQIATGIPTYRQHLWYEVDGDVFSPCYDLNINNKRVYTNIWTLRGAKTFVMGIPVDSNLYADRSSMRVFNNEHDVLLSSVYETSPNAQWFVLDINDIISQHRKQFSEIIKTDVHIRELVYYSLVIQYWPMITNRVFQMFITNEHTVHNEYPELSQRDNAIKKQLDMETSLISKNYNPSISKIPLNIFLSSTNVTTASEHFSYGTTVNLRNLFDKIVTAMSIPYVICLTVINGRTYTLIKQFKGGARPHYKLKPRVESIILMIIIPNIADMYLHINADGTYNIRTMWREDKQVTIEIAHNYMISHANPIIKMINKMGEDVLIRPFMLINAVNINIIDVDIVISIKKRLHIDEFDTLKSNADKYNVANIINISSSDSNSISMHLIKGMYNFDNSRFNAISNVANAYMYNTNIVVRQKWESIYIRQKSCILQNRTADVYIKASGLKDSEYSSFIRYMLQLVHMSISGPTIVEKEHSSRTVSHLKETDPILYDLKRIYRSKKMYSQICQKPNQPKLVTAPTKNSIKYWNFTTNSPIHYECPNAKYPNLYFKTSVHPQNYCIPCCKKAGLVEGSKHEYIYSKCIKHHVYVPKNKNVIKSSYVVSYGKELEEGRLSRLPESSLDQLFYQQHSSTGKSVDNECVSNVGYYVYGIPQNIGLLQHVGVVMTLAHAMSYTLDKLIEETASLIVKNKSKWNLIMDGRIVSHFKSAADFVATMVSTFLTKDEQFNFSMWNDAFIDIARIFWKINFIQFIDNGRGAINITVPSHVKSVEEYFTSHFKHIIIIKNENTYLPIYLIDMNKYKKDGSVETVLFENDDMGIKIIQNMVKHSLSKIEKMSTPSLTRIEQFVDDEKDIDIVSIFVNGRNICYATMLRVGNKEIYFPVIDSLHEHVDVKKISSPFDHMTYQCTVAELYVIFDRYNKWADNKGLSVLKISSWVIVGDDVIGLTDQNNIHYYYISSMSVDDAVKLHDVPIIRQLYSPYVINKIIEQNPPPKKDIAFLSQSIYVHYLYQMFVLEFTSAINRMINDDLRKSIKHVIKVNIKDPIAFISKINAMLKEWPDDYDTLMSIFLRFTRSSGGISQYDRIIGYKNTNYTYNDIAGIIDNSRFMFDDTQLQLMFKMTEADLVKNIDSLMSNVIDKVSKEPTVTSFSDSFSSCFSNEKKVDYCKDGKLVIEKTKYDQYILFLAKDILNPIKRRLLMNNTIKTSMKNFRFITRPNENIFVSA